ETTIEGASHIIINISGDISLIEANEAASYVEELAGENANIIFGAKCDNSLTDVAVITVIATGLADPGAVETPVQNAMAGFGYRPAQPTTARPGMGMGAGMGQTTARPMGMGVAGVHPAGQPMNGMGQARPSGMGMGAGMGQAQPGNAGMGMNRQPMSPAGAQPMGGMPQTPVQPTQKEKGISIPDFLQKK
ncbi:MAG: cell division protein FtsZ, partial [Lachnospiraceae bacterium]